MRLFIAVPIPESLRPPIEETIKTLQHHLPLPHTRVNWVKETQLHITLKFLGEVDKNQVPALQAALDKAVQGMASFPLSLEGLGSFPAKGAPSIIWLRIHEGSQALQVLAAAVETHINPLGFTPETRGFHAHLTLGRVKSPGPSGKLRAFLESQNIGRLGQFQVTHVELIRSVLHPSGPTYTTLHTAYLH